MFLIFTKPGCPYCDQAKKLITDNGYTYDEKSHVTQDTIDEFKSMGYKTFPQIWIGDKHIGGYSNLVEYFLYCEDF